MVLALVAVAAGTAVGYRLAADEEERAVARIADSLAAEARASTQTIMGQAVGGLGGARVVVDASGNIDRDAFEAFGAGIIGAVHEGIGLGIVVPGDERSAFEATETLVTERREDGIFVRADAGSEHFPIVHVVSPDPLAQQVVGFDYASEPVRADTVRRARDAGSTMVSAPTVLSPANAPGFVVVEPLFRRGAPIETVAQRQRAFVGFMALIYPAADVFAAVQRSLPPGTGLAATDAGEVLFQTGGSVEEFRQDDFVRTVEVELPGRVWQVSILPDEEPSTALPTFVLVAGVVAGVGLAILCGVTWHYQRRLRLAFGAGRQTQRRSETLEGLAARLSRSLSGAEVGEALLEQLPPFTGTTAGAVLILDDDGEHLQLLAADGYGDEHRAAIERVDLGVTSAIASVVQSGEPVWLPSPLGWRDDPVTAAFGSVGRAAAIVPLVAGRRVVGVMVLVHPGVRGFYEDERSLLTTVAALAARALNRARRYDAEHDAAVVLQRALLPAFLPELPGVSVAVRYLPATGELAVGGDWYDLFALGDGRIGLVVGDVVGRGVKAAAAMGSLRSAMRALAEVLPEPSALLRAFEQHVPTIPDALCATMVYAVVDPAAGRVTYVRAGHPPPLLLHEAGTAELLEGAVSPPLGVTGGTPATGVTVAVEPGDTLVLYTDGIVERRGEAVTIGLERLRAVGAAAAKLHPEACCDRIVADLLGDEGHGDDAAVVAVRLEPVPSASPRGVEAAAPTSVR